MKSFGEGVWAACRRIPKGKVSTYGGLARAIGSPKSARAVGNALNKNPNTKLTPCHRVIRSDGRVGGFAGGTKKKVFLLKKEGVRVLRGGRVDLKEFLFRL